MQTLWTLGLRAGGNVATGVLPGLSVRADLVIVVEAPLDVVSDRLGSRRSVHSRTQRLPGPDRLAELRRGRELLGELVASSGCERLVLVNDGDQRPPDLARGAAQWVLRAAEGVRG